jgi:hypothetical protein
MGRVRLSGFLNSCCGVLLRLGRWSTPSKVRAELRRVCRRLLKVAACVRLAACTKDSNTNEWGVASVEGAAGMLHQTTCCAPLHALLYPLYAARGLHGGSVRSEHMVLLLIDADISNYMFAVCQQ